MISRNSADDLEKLYPDLPRGRTYVTRVGVAPVFTRPSADECDRFRSAHALQRKRYVVMVGERLGYGGYKNGALAFRALAELPDDKSLVLICVGGRREIEPQLRQLAPRLDVRRLALDDAELCACYAGAHALLFPSKYEGFGMPPLEAMACGTPAIVCRNSSLPEVVGDAAVYVDENDPSDMSNAILKLYDPDLRSDLVARGMKQAALFTFTKMADELAAALTETHERLKAGEIERPSATWTELRAYQQCCQANGFDIDMVEGWGGHGQQAARIHVSSRPELDQALQTIADMRKSPFWKAREAAVRILRKTGLRGTRAG